MIWTDVLIVSSVYTVDGVRFQSSIQWKRHEIIDID
jgi:hypothetical protein